MRILADCTGLGRNRGRTVFVVVLPRSLVSPLSSRVPRTVSGTPTPTMITPAM